MRVILLKGPEPYLQAQYLRLIAEGIEATIGEPPSRFDFDGPQASLAAVLDELRSYGLMQSHKIVVLDAAERGRDPSAQAVVGSLKVREVLQRCKRLEGAGQIL